MYPLTLLSPTTWICALVAALLVTVGVQTVRIERAHTALERERTAHMQTKAAHADSLREIATLGARAAQDALDRQATQQAALAAIDSKLTKERDDALAENDRMRIAELAGRRLRIKATCPASAASGGDVPGASAAARVDAETTVELPSAVGQDVLAIRAGIASDHAALIGLQAYVRDVCPGPPK